MSKKHSQGAAVFSRAAADYLATVARTYRGGETGELAFRAPLQSLLQTGLRGCVSACEVIHEPHQGKYGAPDFAVKKSGAAIGFAEAKKIGADLDAAADSEQLRRYREALPNLILTDYLEFRHYADGRAAPIATVRLADSAFRRTPAGAEDLAKLLQGFAALGQSGRGESPSAERLATMMAGKARLLRALVGEAVADKKSELAALLDAFRQALIRDLKAGQFSDMFAQTAVYGLFAARLEAERTGMPASEFTRMRAGELLPRPTPFLRRFFNSFAGPDMDARVSWLADDIAAMFAAASLDEVAGGFARGGAADDDPFLHFYETFLKKYDPGVRRARGVYFTPRPVVDFIVRAVDDALKCRKKFNIAEGLADAAMLESRGRATHRVQILDPAAGTGAFLARVAEVVRDRVRESAGPGAWRGYAADCLLPRLNGFEIMMSAYAMCHMKMALTLGGEAAADLAAAVADGDSPRRVNVFLTSALEMARGEASAAVYFRWLAEEAEAAEKIKNETPVMVVLGNPPYNSSSKNRGPWINEKIADYRPRGERRIHINDDYVRFMRCAEHFIERNGRGVVAMITNNSFYSGVTHREMRRRLLAAFDEIRVLDLHGDVRKKERAPDGGRDQNVFDIQQGVGVSIMTKTGKKRADAPARLFYAECRGTRARKYEFLRRESVASVAWRELHPAADRWFFVPRDSSVVAEYEKGVSVARLMPHRNSGVQTKRDALAVQFTRAEAEAARANILKLSPDKLREEYGLPPDGRDWRAAWAKDDAANNAPVAVPYCYRPFDLRFALYSGRTKGVIAYPRAATMRHLLAGDNIALLVSRAIPMNQNFDRVLATRCIADGGAIGGHAYVLPLYLDGEEMGENGGRRAVRRPNIDPDAAAALLRGTGLRYSEAETGGKHVGPRALFDYAYAALHGPAYRKRFAECLRIDFPHIPPPGGAARFRALAGQGAKLRELHLLESPALDDERFPFSAHGKNIVEAPAFIPDPQAGGQTGRVAINQAGRHFSGVPKTAWDFCIGGCRPAQKWLKDRKGRALSYEEQRHYRRMLGAMAGAADIMANKLDGNK